MKRVSSATGYNERDLNNTRVFPSQDAIPVVLTVLVVTLALFVQGACGSSGKGNRAGAGTTTDARRGMETLPQRVVPVLPPLVPSPEGVAGQPKGHNGGTLRVHLEAEPMHLNPLVDADAAALQVVMGLVYEPLLSCTPPGTTGDYRPVLADSWHVSPDGMRVSLHLRTGVKWHDGRPLTVLDVQASLEPLLLASGTTSPLLRASLQDIASIELALDRTVRLVLKRRSDFALRALCDVAILPDHLLRGPTADPSAIARQPTGTGPYRFAAWERGKRLKLTRAPRYWSDSAAPEEMIFEVEGDGARALMRTRRGEIDVLPRVLPVHYPNDVDPVTLHGTLDLRRLSPDRWAYVAVNHRRSPLQDPSYRRGLAALWDRERFAADLHQGLAHPLGAPPFAALPPVLSGRAAAGIEFEKSGYRDSNADGVRDLNEKPFRHTLLVATGARNAATEAHAFVFEARKAGILVDLVLVDAPALLTRVRKGDFDLALMMWEGQPDEDPALLFGSTGAFNFSGYRSPEVDGILDELRQAAGQGARRPILAKLGAILAREQPVLFLYQFDVPTLVSRRVKGLASVGGRLDFRHVWITP